MSGCPSTTLREAAAEPGSRQGSMHHGAEQTRSNFLWTGAGSARFGSTWPSFHSRASSCLVPRNQV